MREIILAADLGGTNLRMAAIDRTGEILYRTKRETPVSGSTETIIAAIFNEARHCIPKFGSKIKVFALAVPATVDAKRGIILKAPNIPGLNNFPIAEVLEKELNLQCFLENDANAAAIGETWRGASAGFENSICVTLGTGVGGGIIIEGEILRGKDGTAGEIGHICVEPFGADCGCGSRGCVEQYSSATAIVRLTKELGEKFPRSELLNAENLTARAVYEAGKKGDELALEVFRRQGFYLGIALAGLINVLNPEIIVIGGGAAAGWDLFIDSVREQISRRAYPEPAERAKIIRARLGDDAGLLGAAKLTF